MTSSMTSEQLKKVLKEIVINSKKDKKAMDIIKSVITPVPS